jgi:hypothetical protein
MEVIIEISKVNVDEEFGNKAKILKRPQGSWTTKKNCNNGILECICTFPNSTNEFANLEACKYLNLWDFEELDKLCWQLRLAPPLPSLSKVSSSITITKLPVDYSILVEDPNLCASTTMHNELKCMWRERWKR